MAGVTSEAPTAKLVEAAEAARMRRKLPAALMIARPIQVRRPAELRLQLAGRDHQVQAVWRHALEARRLAKENACGRCWGRCRMVRRRVLHRLRLLLPRRVLPRQVLRRQVLRPQVLRPKVETELGRAAKAAAIRVAHRRMAVPLLERALRAKAQAVRAAIIRAVRRRVVLLPQAGEQAAVRVAE